MQDSSMLKTGTAIGTLAVLLSPIGSADILKTAVMAAVGAAVSFSVSLLLKWIHGRMHKRRP